MIDTLEKVNSIFTNIGAFFSTYWWIFAVVAGLLVLGILCSVVKPVATVCVFIVKIVFWIITAPFKLIGWLFGNKRQ